MITRIESNDLISDTRYANYILQIDPTKMSEAEGYLIHFILSAKHHPKYILDKDSGEDDINHEVRRDIFHLNVPHEFLNHREVYKLDKRCLDNIAHHGARSLAEIYQYVQVTNPIVKFLSVHDAEKVRYVVTPCDIESVLSPHRLGRGRDGIIVKMLGILSPMDGGGLKFKSSQPKVGKLIEIELPGDEVLVAREYLAARQNSKLRVKPPCTLFFSPISYNEPVYGMMLMPLLTGANLFDLVKRRQLSASQCLSISINLAIALRDQVQEQLLIHCDFRPVNIMVNIEVEPVDITIIDFGISRDIKLPSTIYSSCVFEEPDCSAMPAYDLWCLGQVLKFIWGISSIHDRDLLITRNSLSLLSGRNSKKIAIFLDQMTSENPDDRHTTDKVQQFFEEIRLDLRLETMLDGEVNLVKSAHDIAVRLRISLKQYEKTFIFDEDNFTALVGDIRVALKHLPDGSAAIHEFKACLGIKLLYSENSKTDMLMKLDKVEREYLHPVRIIKDFLQGQLLVATDLARNYLRTTNKELCALSSEDITSDLDDLERKARTLISRNHLPLTLDEADRLTPKLTKHLSSLKARFNYMLEKHADIFDGAGYLRLMANRQAKTSSGPRYTR